MKHLQLFCDIPRIERLNELLNCYGIRDLTDTHEFCKGDLTELGTVDKVIELIPELMLYYLPCKANIYLSEITEKRAITILSQFLKLFKHRLLRNEKIVNKKKIIYYRILRLEDTTCHIVGGSNKFSYEVQFR